MFQTAQHQPADVWSKPSDNSTYLFSSLPAIAQDTVEQRKVISTTPCLNSWPTESVNTTDVFLSRQVLYNLPNSYSNWNTPSMLCCQQTWLFVQTFITCQEMYFVYYYFSLQPFCKAFLFYRSGPQGPEKLTTCPLTHSWKVEPKLNPRFFWLWSPWSWVFH